MGMHASAILSEIQEPPITMYVGSLYELQLLEGKIVVISSKHLVSPYVLSLHQSA